MMKNTLSATEQQFGPLRDLTVETTALQIAHARFDFGRDSAVAQHLVQRCFAALEEHDRRLGILRVAPFTLRLDHAGVAHPVALLTREMLDRLVGGHPYGQILRDCRETVFKELLACDRTVTLEHVRRWLAPSERLAAGGRLLRRAETTALKDADNCRMDLARLRETLSVPASLLPAPQELPPPPATVTALLGPSIEKEGKSPELARAFISHVLALRERFCPRLDELDPGQVVAVALDVRDRRMSLKTRYRGHVPVRLTLFRDNELAELETLRPRDRDALDRLLQRRVARLLTEAYCQGGLLSLTLVGLLTHLTTNRVSQLVNGFEATQGLILPTPGTIHDAGSKLTHKAAIVRLHLAGMECKDIARQTFHCEEAVGRYVDDFERVLIALAHGLPAPLLPRVLKLGAHVVVQYQELIREHVGGPDQVRALLARSGVTVKEQAA
jgi:hypothetical protein